MIIGAGALGLGFIGPIAASAGETWLFDVGIKASLLEAIDRRRGYRINQAFDEEVRVVTVDDVRTGIVSDPIAVEALSECDCCFTAVGTENFEAVASPLRAAARVRATPLLVLCGENGIEVARRLSTIVGKDENVCSGDTIMSRMCRFMDRVEDGYTPLCEGVAAGITTDDVDVIQYHLQSGSLPSEYDGMQQLGEEEFALYTHMKLFGHNCLHALYAFASAKAGFTRIADVCGSAMLADRAHRMLFEELGPALARHHRTLFDAETYRTHMERVTSRIVSKGLNDTVDRGVRGATHKLRPSERWVQAVRLIRSAGIPATAYLETMADIILESGLLNVMTLEDLLANQCGFDGDELVDALTVIEPIIAASIGGDSNERGRIARA